VAERARRLREQAAALGPVSPPPPTGRGRGRGGGSSLQAARASGRSRAGVTVGGYGEEDEEEEEEGMTAAEAEAAEAEEERAWMLQDDDATGLKVNIMEKLTLRRKEDGTLVQPPMRRTRTDVEAAIEATHDTVNVKDTVGLMLKLLKQQPREPPNGRYSHLIGRWMQFG
jgi:hypothetical protein